MAKRPIETMLPYVKKPKTPFSAYLGAAGVNINDIIGHSDISNLDIVYADSGIPNASLVCSSRPYKKLVEELSAAYDCVVINAPIDMIDDTVKVASFADASLLVTACGGARRSDVVGLCQSLSDENVNVIGSVLTQVKNKPLQVLNRKFRLRPKSLNQQH